MRIEASIRLTAATTQKQLLEFLLGLGPKETSFFFYDLPDLLSVWLEGMGKKKSQHLPLNFASTIEAKSYKRVDAIAVALGHLRHIYPPKLPATIYRSMLVPRIKGTPESEIFNFVSDKAWSAMQSWTVNKLPEVMDRDVNADKQFELVLETPSAKVYKHVVSDYAQLGILTRDAIALAPKLEKLLDKTDGPEVYTSDAIWRKFAKRLDSFKSEKEVLLYVPAGTVIKCTWRAYDIDHRGRRSKYTDSAVPTVKKPASKSSKGFKPVPGNGDYFKTVARPFKHGKNIYATTGRSSAGLVQGIPIAELKKASHSKEITKVPMMSFPRAQCKVLDKRNFIPATYALINRYLNLKGLL